MRSRLRRLTRRLSVQIFLAFWLAMTLVGAVLLLVEASRSERLTSQWRGVTGDAWGIYASSAARDYELDPPDGARRFLESLNQRTEIKAYLFQQNGRELSGYSPDTRHGYPLWLQVRLDQLVKKAWASGEPEFDSIGPTLAAQAVHGPSGKRYVLAGTLPSTRYSLWQASALVQAARLLAVLAAAAVVSWFLAKRLSTPVERLRSATHRLAAGNFAARAEVEPHHRDDELASLAFDFNAMAERLESLRGEQDRLMTAQRHLLADVAHELRSPLARASIALELARDQSIVLTALPVSAEGEGPDLQTELEPLTEAMDRIELEIGRLRALIDQILVLSRLESGAITPGDIPNGLGTILTGIVADANFEAGPSRKVTLDGPPPGCIVRGSPELLQSAIENVVRNAGRHTADNSIVEVRLRHLLADDPELAKWAEGTGGAYLSPSPPASTDWAVISVRDHGPGLPVEELGAVFQPFYRAGGGRSLQSGGVGLGLSITLRAVELHGGQVRAANAEGGGLLVEVRLPVDSIA